MDKKIKLSKGTLDWLRILTENRKYATINKKLNDAANSLWCSFGCKGRLVLSDDEMTRLIARVKSYMNTCNANTNYRWCTEALDEIAKYI